MLGSYSLGNLGIPVNPDMSSEGQTATVTANETTKGGGFLDWLSGGVSTVIDKGKEIVSDIKVSLKQQVTDPEFMAKLTPQEQKDLLDQGVKAGVITAEERKIIAKNLGLSSMPSWKIIAGIGAFSFLAIMALRGKFTA